MSSPLAFEDTTPLSPSQLAAIGRAQGRISENAMTKVYDPDSKSLVDIPATEEKQYLQAGFKTGPDALLEVQKDSSAGALASGSLGLASGASGGLTDFMVPSSLRTLRDQVDALHPVAKIAGEMSGGLASLAAAGGAGAAVAARVGAAKYGALAAAASRVALGAAEGGERAALDAARNNTALTAERFMQGAGMGAAYSLAGEGVGEILSKSAPAFQRATGAFLKKASTFGYLKKIGGVAKDAFVGGGDDAGVYAEEASRLGDEARAAFGGLREPAPSGPMPGEQGWSSGQPPPLPPRAGASEIPFAQAELIETKPPGPTFDEPTRTRLANDQPLSEADSLEGWKQSDREAGEASKMGQPELADDLRADRDYYSKNRGMAPDEMSQWASGRDELLAADPEVEGAFDHAGFNGGGEEVSGGLTDVPPRMTPEATPEPVSFKSRRPKPPPLRSLGNAERAGVAGDAFGNPEFPRSDEVPYHPIPERAAATKAGSKWGKYDKYELKQEQDLGKVIRGYGTRGTIFGLMHMIPQVGPIMSGTFAAAQAALYAGKKATVFALNHEAALNAVLERVMIPATKLTGSVVKGLFEAGSPNFTAGYLSGHTDKEYEAISQGALNATADPETLENYYQARYGQMLAQNPELYGNIVAQSAKQHMYVASKIPKDPRNNPGMFDPPYDPPRSDKVKVIQAFNGANNPYSVLTEPTAEGIEAVQATHPETLALVQKMIYAKLADPKVAAQLTPEQTKKLSIILQAPVMGRDSPEFLGLLQTLAQMNGADPTPPQQGGPGQGGVPNLGQQGGKAFASAVAPPSAQQNLDDL